MSESRFYICEKCGNTVGMINDKGVPLICCGVPMKHLEPNGHAVKVEKIGNVVRVNASKTDHWVYLQTNRGGQRKMTDENDGGNLSFSLLDEEPRAVYAFDGNNGISKTDI